MKKLFSVLLLILSVNLFAQTNVVNYKFRLKYTIQLPFGQITNTYTVDTGSFNEGENYILPSTQLEGDLVAFQTYYDIIAGSRFLLDENSINQDLWLDLILDVGINTKGYPNPLFGQDLFFDLTGDVYVDNFNTIYNDGKPYYFNQGTYLNFLIPRTTQFESFLENMGIQPDSTGFRFILENGFSIDDIITEVTDQNVAFRSLHLSRFGGGRKNLPSSPPTGIEELINSNPQTFSLAQNYPNPFNPATTIEYSIPEQGFVSLKVFNLLGEEIATLVQKDLSAGTYRVGFDGSSLSSGIYFYKLIYGNNTITKKMTIIK